MYAKAGCLHDCGRLCSCSPMAAMACLLHATEPVALCGFYCLCLPVWLSRPSLRAMTGGRHENSLLPLCVSPNSPISSWAASRKAGLLHFCVCGDFLPLFPTESSCVAILMTVVCDSGNSCPSIHWHRTGIWMNLCILHFDAFLVWL